MISSMNTLSTPDIIIRNSSNKTILAPIKSLTYKNCEQLEKAFTHFLKLGVIDIVLDMKQVPFVDSATLELFVTMESALKEKERDLIILGLNDVCKDIFICVRLINHFKIIAKQ
jgi:anti-anti-sigma factor